MSQSALIFGAGLAGTCMAHQLLNKGLKVTLVDAGQNHSSAIAAGIVNPMVFRRMNKSWRLDEFLKEARGFYQALEQRLQSEFYQPISIRRFFSSHQERLLWELKSIDSAFENYLEKITEEDLINKQADNQFGSGRVKSAFWIDAAKFIALNRQLFIENGNIIFNEFESNKWDPGTKKYDAINYDIVVFCLGYRQKNESTFAYLPLQQTKGQTLLIQSNQITQKELLNRKCFVLPTKKNVFKVGATYEWNNATLNTTKEAEAHLVQNLAALGTYDYEILEQTAGVRPTVLDRRPLMGEHPKFKGVFIFNGLGAKGYMMAPTLARELSEHILFNTPLHPETNIKRFADSNGE